jgi:predicted phosphodiesterase
MGASFEPAFCQGLPEVIMPSPCRKTLPADARILILADIHGNWPALAAVASAAAEFTHLIFLGDAVNYGPDPAQCIAWLRERQDSGHYIKGNHDEALSLGRSPRCVPGKSPFEKSLLDSTIAALDDDEKHFLLSLPTSLALDIGDQYWRAFHGLPSNPLCGYLPIGADPQLLDDEIKLADSPDVLLVAHTHVQFSRQHGSTLVINPGSVGRPKDGDPRAAYAIYENRRIHLRRVEYDIGETQRRLSRLLPHQLATKLGDFLLAGQRAPNGHATSRKIWGSLADNFSEP